MTIKKRHFERLFDSFNRKELHDPSLTPAGVLLPFFEKEGELHLLLTERTNSVEHHKGQISFPGGARDVADASIIETALREAEEEIGLPRECVEVLGTWNDVWTPTGFVITPVVGFLSSVPSLKMNSSEVANILEVPIALFLDRTKERVEQRMRDGKRFDVYFYDFGELEIWGATAWITRSILAEIVALEESD
jgi:8-oxo-dGTP pyrophosphatase MutT (NUDIX family)